MEEVHPELWELKADPKDIYDLTELDDKIISPIETFNNRILEAAQNQNINTFHHMSLSDGGRIQPVYDDATKLLGFFVFHPSYPNQMYPRFYYSVYNPEIKQGFLGYLSGNDLQYITPINNEDAQGLLDHIFNFEHLTIYSEARNEVGGDKYAAFHLRCLHKIGEHLRLDQFVEH